MKPVRTSQAHAAWREGGPGRGKVHLLARRHAAGDVQTGFIMLNIDIGQAVAMACEIAEDTPDGLMMASFDRER